MVTNPDAVNATTLEEVKAWMTLNLIPTTGAISLELDHLGFVKTFDTVETLTAPQITDFEETFFHRRIEGNQGEDVASAGTITLTEGNFFDITGAVTINYITTIGWKTPSVVRFQFNTGITLNHNTGSVPADTAAMFLNGSANATFTAGSTLTLLYDGTLWRELARMVA